MGSHCVDALTKYKVYRVNFLIDRVEQFSNPGLLTGFQRRSKRLQIYGLEWLCHHPATREQCSKGEVPSISSAVLVELLESNVVLSNIILSK